MKMGNGDGRFLRFVSLVVTSKRHETESVNHKEFKRENSQTESNRIPSGVRPPAVAPYG